MCAAQPCLECVYDEPHQLPRPTSRVDLCVGGLPCVDLRQHENVVVDQVIPEIEEPYGWLSRS